MFVQKPFLKQQRLSIMCAYIIPINYGTKYKQSSYINTYNYIETKTKDFSLLKNAFVVEISYRFNKGKAVKSIDKEVDVKKEKISKGLF